MKDLELLVKNIKNKELLPIYFFHGPEPYFIDVAVQALEDEVLSEEEKAFGMTVLYGKETDISTVLSYASQIPMMGEYNLIIIKEAQDLRFDEKSLELLARYTQNPLPTTILVFAYKHGKMDERKKFMKPLKNGGMLFFSEQIKDYKIAGWIREQFTHLGIKAEPRIADLLADHLGSDLSRIASELNKLKIILSSGQVLDGKLVETHIGISKDFNIFELKSALAEKDHKKALRIAHYMGKNTKNLGGHVTVLYRLFCDIIFFHTMPNAPESELVKVMSITNPFFLNEIRIAARNYPLKQATRVLSILREVNMKERGVGATNVSADELLKEMVYKILHVDQIEIAL